MSALPPLTLVEIGEYNGAAHESLSPFCLKAHRALKALGLPYERKIIWNPAQGRQYNPTGQFPTLLVGEEKVPDSTAILNRLNALTGGKLNPDPDPAVRAEALLWEELGDTAVNGFLIAARWVDDRNWKPVSEVMFQRMPKLVLALLGPRLRKRMVRALVARDVWRAGPEACWRRFQALLDQLEDRAPRSGYWVGKALSVADIGLFSQLHQLRLPITAWQAEQIAKRPHLSAYLDRIHQETWQPAKAPSAAA